MTDRLHKNVMEVVDILRNRGHDDLADKLKKRECGDE